MIGLLLPVRCSPRLRSSRASQSRVLRMLIILGSRIGHFCSNEAVRSTMNEKTGLRPLSSASSTLAWDSPRDTKYSGSLTRADPSPEGLSSRRGPRSSPPGGSVFRAQVSRHWILKPCKIVLTSSASLSGSKAGSWSSKLLNKLVNYKDKALLLGTLRSRFRLFQKHHHLTHPYFALLSSKVADGDGVGNGIRSRVGRA